MIPAIIILTEILHLLILNQLTFTAWPEMLSYPYLLSNGFLPYKDFIFPYPPLLVLILSSIFNIFGYSPFVLKIFTWILILLTDFFVYLVLKKISKNNLILILFLLIYIFLQSFLDGNMLWFDFASVLPLLAGLYFCLVWQSKQKVKYLFFVGIFLSLATVIKQVNILYFLALAIFYFSKKKKFLLKEVLYLISGCLIIFIPFLFYILHINATQEFFNWVIFYPIAEWSKFPGYVNFNISKRQLITIVLIFSPLLFAVGNWKNFFKDKVFLLIFSFLLVSLITIYPRFSFFHLQPAIAFLVIILAKVFGEISQKLKVLYLISVLITALLVVVLNFKLVVGVKIRFYNKQDLQLSEEIMWKTRNNQTIYLLGINSSEYVYTNKIPSKHWSDNYGWYLEISGIQKWVIDGFVQDHPKIIFWKVPKKGNWYDLGVYQPLEIVNYIRLNYHKTGNIESDIEIWEKD